MSGPSPKHGHRLLLGIDCATEFLALSLVQAPAQPGPADRASTRPTGGAEVARSVTHLGRDHAARIMGELEALLHSAGASKSDVAGVGVGVGPGSYTGVRIAVATAVALGRAWRVPVGGASSLLALFSSQLQPGQSGVALLDARKGNVYALPAQRLPGPHALFRPISEPQKVPRDQVPELFPGLPLHEGPPDAAPLARLALSGGPLKPYYL